MQLSPERKASSCISSMGLATNDQFLSPLFEAPDSSTDSCDVDGRRVYLRLEMAYCETEVNKQFHGPVIVTLEISLQIVWDWLEYTLIISFLFSFLIHYPESSSRSRCLGCALHKCLRKTKSWTPHYSYLHACIRGPSTHPTYHSRHPSFQNLPPKFTNRWRHKVGRCQNPWCRRIRRQIHESRGC